MLKKLLFLAVAIAFAPAGPFPAQAQRQLVLPQIDLPHHYYLRELYLPQLTSGPSSVAWSPDSHELIYSMAGSLWRQKLDNMEAVQLTDGPGYDYQPDWSPDGKMLALISNRNGNTELWLLQYEGGAQRRLEIAMRRYLKPTMTISLRVTDEHGELAPARVSITGEDGRFYAPANA